LVGKPEGKRQLGRPGNEWRDIRVDLREMWESVRWIHLALDRDQHRTLRNAVMKLMLP